MIGDPLHRQCETWKNSEIIHERRGVRTENKQQWKLQVDNKKENLFRKRYINHN